MSGGIVANPLTPWTSGQFVQTGTAGAAGRVTWSGSAWVGGAAPLAVEQESAKIPQPEQHTRKARKSKDEPTP